MGVTVKHFYELDAYVRENWPEYRVYSWRSVESMRDSLADHGLALSRERVRATQSEKELLQLKRELSELMGVMREAKDYHYSDKIREILPK